MSDDRENLRYQIDRARTETSSPETSESSGSEAGEIDPNIGAVFDDEYVIEECIGGGGMGVVYRARQRSRDRPCAVKLLSERRLDDDASIQRFRREARTLSQLEHPNIVDIYGFGTDDEASYIAMEYVDGLQLDRPVREEDGFESTRFLHVAKQLFDAVGQAHREGLIHRDLKPSNIMLEQRGERNDFVKVLDFGLAKLVSGEEDVTKQHSLVGSMPYLAPEQICGDPVDQRSDVYSLGIVLYFMLTARKPFRGPTTSILYDQVHSDPPPLELHVSDPSVFSPELFEVVRACLNKEPDERPKDAAAVLECLRNLDPTAVDTDSTSQPSNSARSPSGSGSPKSKRYEIERSSSELVHSTLETAEHGELHRSEPRRISTKDSESRKRTERIGLSKTKGGWEETTRLRKNGRLLVFTTIAVLVSGGALLFAWSSTENGGDASVTDETKSEPNRAGHANWDRFDRLITNGEVETARDLLESLEGNGAGSKNAGEQLDRAKRRLRAARLYETALEARARQRLGVARERLKEVENLAGDFRNTADLRDELERYGRLTVRANRESPVRVDGREVGTTPVGIWLEAGEYELEILREERSSSSRTVRLGPGENIRIDADESE